MRRLDVAAGSIFGRLVVLREGSRLNQRRRFYCRCACGAERLVHLSALRAGLTVSCGCWRREITQRVAQRHGHAVGGRKTRVYRIWRGMNTRCDNPKHQFYKYYGGRGISVCRRWRNFEKFLADMGEPPPGTSIERVDRSRGYGPANCRWASAKDQSRNSRRAKLTSEAAEKIRSDVRPRRVIAADFGVSPETVRRAQRGETWV